MIKKIKQTTKGLAFNRLWSSALCAYPIMPIPQLEYPNISNFRTSICPFWTNYVSINIFLL